MVTGKVGNKGIRTKTREHLGVSSVKCSERSAVSSALLSSTKSRKCPLNILICKLLLRLAKAVFVEVVEAVTCL